MIRAVLALLLALAPVMALAQEASPPRPAAQERANRPGRQLPPDAVTHHSLDLPGRTLRFTARAGSLALTDAGGAVQAEIGFVAYMLDGAEARRRPVTFAVNGGPGAASAYLHLGVMGPWRLPLDGPSISPSAAPALLPNAETWLDFTDLVFIDPVNTGYSRAAGSGEEVAGRYYTVEGDIAALAEVVQRWLKEHDRLASPKFFAGESYGGFRGPLLAAKLQGDHGIGLSGLVLVSPVLDFAWLSQPRHNVWAQAARLPSLAAAAAEAREGARAPITREQLAEAEGYAAGEYLTDLTRGVQDGAALDRASGRVAALTGLDPALVRRLAARIDVATFQRELERGAGRIVSAYDTGISAYDPDPNAAVARFEDPLLTGSIAPLTSAAVDHLSRRLGFRAEGRYHLLNGAVNGAWRWGRGRTQPEVMGELRQVLALDGRMRVLVVHGFTDLITPYFASELLLRQVPDYGSQRRVALKVYPGGHMFYSRDASRTAFRDDAAELIRLATLARENEEAGR